jgi:hypothetical protein
MNRRDIFLERIAQNNEIADDTARTLAERVRALTEIYFTYQGDVHMQARTIRRITDLCQ